MFPSVELRRSPDLQRAAMANLPDLSDYLLKIDHFPKIHVLGTGSQEGAPNFRGITSAGGNFPVFGSAQPTQLGIFSVVNKIPKPDSAPPKIIWYNTRKEPVVYINGTPFAPRHPNNLHQNIQVDATPDDLDQLEKNLIEIIKKRVEASPDGRITIHKDIEYAVNASEREDLEDMIKATDIKDTHDVFCRSGLTQLSYVRVPIAVDACPTEETYDILVDSLKNEPASTNCVFSCQMGKGRTTFGMIVAYLIKEVQISSKIRKMSTTGVLTRKMSSDLINMKFGFPPPAESTPDDRTRSMQYSDDGTRFLKGNFDVIQELLEKFPETVEAKKKIDYIIDLNGPAPGGVGLQNLRECIIEAKWVYDVALEEKQENLKEMIMDFIKRYFYLICFTTYALEEGTYNFEKSFVTWMDERKELRTMIEKGKDKLEWERRVDAKKLCTLQNMMNTPDWKDKLGCLIKTVYAFAFETYADLPRGIIKSTNIRRLAAQTLMEVVPPEIAEVVEAKLQEEPDKKWDFVTLIGLVSYYGDSKDGKVSNEIDKMTTSLRRPSLAQKLIQQDFSVEDRRPSLKQRIIEEDFPGIEAKANFY